MGLATEARGTDMSVRERARVLQTALLDAIAASSPNGHRPLDVRRYARGERLIRGGEPAASVIALRTGFVKLLCGQNDGGALVGIRGPGEFLGEESIVDGRPDRKSTRLNSSHRCISYAVFCLKKT